jgi:hypothetical protein
MYDCSSFPSPNPSSSACAGRPCCAPRRIAAALAIVGFPILATWPVLAPVTSHAMLPHALSNLPGSIEAILAIPDTAGPPHGIDRYFE